MNRSTKYEGMDTLNVTQVTRVLVEVEILFWILSVTCITILSLIGQQLYSVYQYNKGQNEWNNILKQMGITQAQVNQHHANKRENTGVTFMDVQPSTRVSQ